MSRFTLPDGTPYELVTDYDRLAHVAREIEESDAVGFDIENTGFVKGAKKGEDKPSSVFRDKIRLASIETSKGLYVVDLFRTAGETLWRDGLGPIIDALANPKVVKVIQNAKHEQKWLLYHYGLELWPLFDPWRASELIWNGKEMPQDLYSLYERYLKYHPGTGDLGASDWSAPNLTREQYDYSAGDVARMRSLRETIKPLLTKHGLNRIALIEFGAILPEAAIELNGFPINEEMWLALAAENAAKAEELRKQLVWELPNPKPQLTLLGFEPSINLDSPPQMLASLRKLGVRQTCDECRGRGKNRGQTCGACRGERWVELKNTQEMTLAMQAADFPVIEKLLEYRGASKSVSTYGPEYLEIRDPGTKRIHTSFWPFTDAGRYTCRPNTQNVPRDTRFRKCYRAPDGKAMVIADWANIEMRIIADITKDPLLVSIFKEGDGDAHRVTASILTGKRPEDVTKQERQQSKPVNFGFCYGMQAPKMVLYARANYGVTLSLQQAIDFRRKFFEGYRRIAQWHEEIFSDSYKKRGVCRTGSGRLRYLQPDAHNEWANCVDGDTEALTKRGWVKGFDLSKDDILLTKNPVTGVLEWQGMTDLRLFPDYEGPLVEFKSRSFSAVSTPNHRWLVWDKKSGRDVEKTTSTLSRYGDHRIHRTGVYEGPPATLSNDFVELSGWFLTDGSFETRPRVRSEDREVVFLYQSQEANPALVSRIDTLLDRMRLTCWRSVSVGKVTWGLPEEVSRRLHATLPERILTPDYLALLTPTQARLLLDIMVAGDGWVEGSGKIAFCTRSKENAGLFQALVTLCGKTSTLHERDMSGYEPKSSKLKSIPKMGTIFVVNVLRRTKAQVLKRHCREFVTKQGVWCPVVPNTFFVARRDGHVYVTGNTPVQGLGADGLKAALREVYFRMKKLSPWNGDVQMIHMVHDEIILETKDDEEVRRIAGKELKEGMETAMQQFLRDVPVLAEEGSGHDWSAK